MKERKDKSEIMRKTMREISPEYCHYTETLKYLSSEKRWYNSYSMLKKFKDYLTRKDQNRP